jgi:aminomethyltransferase
LGKNNWIACFGLFFMIEEVKELTLKTTPFLEKHITCGGKMIDFGGWNLPVQYAGVLKEHAMVRERAGLFDVSHMGEFVARGRDAEAFLDRLLTNRITAMRDGQAQYNVMCYPDGGAVDDLIVYRFNAEYYMIVVNAANVDKDWDWFLDHVQPFQAELTNRSADYAQLAVQGPKAQDILQKIVDVDLNEIVFFHFRPQVQVAGVEAIVSRTGYTGEDGFEIYLSAGDAPPVWDAILEAGGDEIAPIGLGARDTLRFEAKLPLYGQELDVSISPIEAGLGFFVKLDKPDFIGKEALTALKADPLSRQLVEFVMLGRGIPRPHYAAAKAGKPIGHVTTGAFAPTLGKAIGLALLERPYTEPDTEFDVIIREKAVRAQVKKGLFYAKKTKTY